MEKVRVYCGVLFTLSIWSSDFILGKYLNQYLPPISSTMLRFLFAVIALALLLAVKGEFQIPPKGIRLQLLVLGIIGIGIFNPLGYVALQYTSSINSALINSMSPCATALLSFLFFRQRITRTQGSCILIGIAGVVFVIMGNNGGSWNMNLGDALIVINVFLWASYNVFGKNVMKVITPLQASFYTCLAGLLFMIPMGSLGFRSISSPDEINSMVWLSIAAMGVFGSCFGMYFWYCGIDRIGALNCSLLYNLIPFFTAVLAVAINGERLSAYHLIGGALIIFSSFASILSQKNNNFPVDTGKIDS